MIDEIDGLVPGAVPPSLEATFDVHDCSQDSK